MPKLKTIQSNFSSGELSPEGIGRVDIARYQNAAKTLTNVIAKTLGGASKRAGLEYIQTTKNSAKASRLVPYVISQDEAYMLEVGEYYVRFYKPDGTRVGAPYEIVTPYTEAQVPDADFAQGEDSMYLFHPLVFPQRLIRYAEANWKCSDAPFTTTPFSEQGEYPAVVLTLSANTVGTGRTMTVATTIKTVSASDAATDRITVTGHGYAVGRPVYYLQTTAIGGLVSYTRYYVVTVVDANTIQLSATLGGAVIDITGATGTGTLADFVFMQSDVGRAVLWNSGTAIITAFTSASVVTVEVKSIFDSATLPTGVWNLDSSPQTTLTPSASTPVGAAINLTLSANGWRSDEVKFVRINSGLVKITSYTSPTVAVGTIINELLAVTAAPGLAWTLESTQWSTKNGYPRTGTLHEQRLAVASNTLKPQTIWGSRIGEPLDFTIGVIDDEAFSFTIAGDDSQVNQISFLVSARQLLVLTFGGEFSMRGGVEKPITPTNVQVQPQSPHGVRAIRPVQVAKETLFVQRSGRKLRAISYKYDQDGYVAEDTTVLSQHITNTGIAGLAFQQIPDPIVWVWLNNGRLVSLTIDRELDVLAWTRHEIDGAVESVAVMPSGDSEQVWLIIRRLVNGSIVRYVERMQPDWYPIYGTASPSPNVFPPADEPVNWGFQLDCAKTQDDAAGKVTWTGLDHLAGRSVRVLADGVDMGAFTVTGGSITLPRTAKRVLAGLMFTPTVDMLAPEIQTQTGTSQGEAMSTNEVTLRFHNTIGATVNGDQVLPGRITGPAQLDIAPELFSGDVATSVTGWNKGDSPLAVSQDAPFPFHLLAVIRTLTINGG